MEQIKNLILLIARSLVDEPDQVKVNLIDGQSTFVFELSVAKKDMGKIIGKQGKTVSAFRTILSASTSKSKKRCTLEIVE